MNTYLKFCGLVLNAVAISLVLLYVILTAIGFNIHC